MLFEKKKLWLNVLAALALSLALVAIVLYPGGHQSNLHSKGFSMIHNYWCNLLDPIAMNGENNPGRSFAIGAGLLGSLAIFISMWSLARLYLTKAIAQNTAVTGLGTSMIGATLLFTPWHNFFVGLLILGLTTYGVLLAKPIWKSAHSTNRWMLVLTCTLLLLTSMVYYTSVGLEYLPLLQKIALLSLVVSLYLLSKVPTQSTMVKPPV